MRSELLETENIFFTKIVPDLSKKLITLVDKLLNLLTLLIGAITKPPKNIRFGEKSKQTVANLCGRMHHVVIHLGHNKTKINCQWPILAALESASRSLGRMSSPAIFSALL